MKDFWEIIVRLRPTILVAVIAFGALSAPAQILELYLIDIETTRAALPKDGAAASLWQFLGKTHQIPLAAAAGLFAMVVLCLSSAHLVCLDPTIKDWTRGRAALAKVLVVVITLAPILGVLFGENNIRTNIDKILPPPDPSCQQHCEEYKALYAQFKSDVNIYTLLSVACLVTAAAAATLITAKWLNTLAALSGAMFARRGLVVGVGLILLLTAGITIWPAALPWAIGTLALIYLFLAALAFVLTWFSHVFRRTGWPVTVMVVAAAFVFSVSGLNDNHWVEYKTVDNKPVEANQERTPGLETSFWLWLHARADRGYFAEKKKPYPVYIVAAEGGGMYAGYHVASFLGRMQDICPNFAQHTFAISSVSGGSLGAGVFATLAKRFAYNQDWQACNDPDSLSRNRFFEPATREFFRTDLLSPLVGATLFPDLLQRLLPFPLKALDRARALEKGFEYAWTGLSETVGQKAKGWEDDFQSSIQSLWDPSKATPALFLHTTNVETGARYTLSPIAFGATPTSSYYGGGLCPTGATTFELPLGSAVSLSARFPWLTPAGWLKVDTSRQATCEWKTGIAKQDEYNREQTKGLDRIYLADGGYFENSGLEGAVEMATKLRAYAKANPASFPDGVDITIITVAAVTQFQVRYAHGRSKSSPGELLAPIKTMLSTRQARTRAVQLRESEYDDSYNQLSYSTDPKEKARYYKIEIASVPGTVDGLHQVALDSRGIFLPLGWRLSQSSMSKIDNPDWGNSKLTQQLIVKELAGEDTNALKGRPPRTVP